MSAFWNFVNQFVPGTLAKAEDINTNLDGINTGFNLIESEISNTIKITTDAGITDIGLNAVARANKLLSFDTNGDIAASTILGDYKGDHADAAGTDYEIRDTVKDAAGSIGQDNIYICNTTHTSTGDLATDTANWDLLVEVAGVAASAAAALVSENNAATSADFLDDRILGAFTTAAEPTLDNDGGALLTGVLYFNTDLNRMKVYNGASWQLTTANAVDIVNVAAGDIAAINVQDAINELDTEKVPETDFSAFGKTLIDDADSEAARATLEVVKEGVYRGIAGGTADALTSTLNQTLPSLTDEVIVSLRALLPNATTAPTFAPDGLAAWTITKNGSQPLAIGDIAGVDHELLLKSNSTNTGWELLNPSIGPSIARSILNNSNHISGLILSNDADTEHDINITAGYANDSTNAYSMNLPTEITKQIDAIYADGDDAGGMFTGSVAVDTWYHVFLIRKDSDGSIDAGFDTSITAANIPSGYTAYAYLDTILTDGSSNIIQFTQYPDRTIEWVTPIADSSTALTAATQTITLSVPIDVQCMATFGYHIADTTVTTIRARFFSTASADVAITLNNLNAGGGTGSSDSPKDNGQLSVMTDTSAQIKAKASETLATSNIHTISYKVLR